MFEKITPEAAGVPSSAIEAYVRMLEKRGLVTHSLLFMKGNSIFGEYYWHPFHQDFCHRMYSETKSFVGVAIGLLEEDGLLSLDDKIAKHFPDKIDRNLPKYLANQTIRDMLTMETCGKPPSWFAHSDPDRTHLYFEENVASMPSGMRFLYDSPGSQVLCALAERLSGKSLFDFLNERIFCHLSTFKTATILKTKTEDSFGDSALLATPRDMASFGRFVMNYGIWNGKRLMNEAYLRKATSRVVDNNREGFDGVFSHGYGYQIWRTEQNGFAFNGMGCQFTVCLPDRDLIMVYNGDNQGYKEAKALIIGGFFDLVVDQMKDSALPEDPIAYEKLEKLGSSLSLYAIGGEKTVPFAKELSGREYVCEENEAGITKFSLIFEGDRGEFRYTNAQGDKVLPFGMCRNEFSKFPQFGYSNEHAGLPTTDGFLYDCASSAAWREEQKLLLKVQIIDRYFGNMFAVFSFKGDIATINMEKNAEAFLKEYKGEIVAKLKK